jgi:hypothetical protein
MSFFWDRVLGTICLGWLRTVILLISASWVLFFFFFLLVGLGLKLRASHLQSRCSTYSSTPPVHFAVVILEMGSQELFGWAALKSWSSGSQPPK